MPSHDEEDRRTLIGEGASQLHNLDWESFRRQVIVLSDILEKMRLSEYIAYLNRPLKLLLINFGVGLLRGLGAAVGASILFGVVLIWLKELGMLNLPVIGGLIAELVKIVNSHVSQ